MPVIFFHTIEASKSPKRSRSLEEKILTKLRGDGPRPLCTTIANIEPNQPKVNIYAHEDPENISLAFDADVKFHGGWASSLIYTNEYWKGKKAAERPYHEVVDDMRKFQIANGEAHQIFREKYTIASALRKNEEIAGMREAEKPKYFSNNGKVAITKPEKDHYLGPMHEGLAANEYHVEARIYNVRSVVLTAEQDRSQDGLS